MSRGGGNTYEMAGARRCWRRAPSTYQPACKPGSVRRRFRRVTAIPLGRRLPGASSNLPGRQDPDTGPAACAARRPYSVLLPVGFAVPLPSPEARCALTAPFHPYPPSPLRASVGGLLSVALSLKFAALARGFFRRTLSGTACPWSPDFPLKPAFRHWTQAAVRPTDATDLGALRAQIKQSAAKPLTAAAALRPSIGRRCRRRARDGNGAGTP